ncbi:Hypothetical predicted protein [Cloeon dipterum]|uniref:C-type lectin domain-containing protein n=1 Tax=Cloeon dipterum TaxID=197152 RepID=A0A8S1D444_9INSE|nr:Hypothetical predicted protein [Cloeon dipterum]
MSQTVGAEEPLPSTSYSLSFCFIKATTRFIGCSCAACFSGNDCSNCVDDSLGSNTINRWTMPLLKLGEKRYYLGIFFKANWYKANRYCRYHGMQLASIDTEEENKFLQETIASQGSWAGQVASQRLTLGGFLSLPRE